MNKKIMFTLKDKYSNETKEVTLPELLEIINRDRSEEWIDYDESDWMEGWLTWEEGDCYNLINISDPIIYSKYLLKLSKYLLKLKEKNNE
jgi:hypothetical protein